jgi:hypothetical protein
MFRLPKRKINFKKDMKEYQLFDTMMIAGIWEE